MAVGLWLPASVVEELLQNDAGLDSLAQGALAERSVLLHHEYVSFWRLSQCDRVKEQVYLPDWTQRSRISYNEQIAQILTQLLRKAAMAHYPRPAWRPYESPWSRFPCSMSESPDSVCIVSASAAMNKPAERFDWQLNPNLSANLTPLAKPPSPSFEPCLKWRKLRNCLSTVQNLHWALPGCLSSGGAV